MKFRVVLALFLLFLLAGCTTPEQQQEDALNTQTELNQKTVVPETKKLTLSEMNLKASDFSSGYTLNETVSGYYTDALKASQGDSAKAQRLTESNWKARDMVLISNISVDDEPPQQGAAIVSMIDEYDDAGNVSENFSKSLDEVKAVYSVLNHTVLTEEFGDNSYSINVKVPETSGSPGAGANLFIIIFIKGDKIVNLIASGSADSLSENDVIKYTRVLENRVQ